MGITALVPETGTRHADVIAGLTAFAAFLETHPDLPLGNDPLHYHVIRATDEAERAEVDRIAAILGVAPEVSGRDGSHYTAMRRFGGGVTYTATAITKQQMDSYYATMSYSGSVKPEARAA